MQTTMAVQIEPSHMIYGRGVVKMPVTPKKRKSRANEPIIIMPPKVYIQETGEVVDMTDEHRCNIGKRRDEVFIEVLKQEVLKELGLT